MSQDSVAVIAFGASVFAVLAAIASMLSNFHSSEAMLDQIQASNQWAYYQAKGIKGSILVNKVDLLTQMGKLATSADMDKIAEYKKEQDQISEKAREKETSSLTHIRKHTIFSRSTTLFQVAIGMAAIAGISRRSRFWKVSLVLSLLGILFLAQGLMSVQSFSLP
ncbi:MAG: DUF4337 domain-containing protein [Bdellovibrionia bacterium]